MSTAYAVRHTESGNPEADAKTVGAGTATPLRTGESFLADLRAGERTIFVDGERVSDPTSHPAFRGAARTYARLFDYAAAPENRECMTYTSPDTGGPVWRCFQIPRSHADLKAKRLAAEGWAEQTFGLMGRTPDHVSNFFAGFASKPEFFARGGKEYAENVVNFYKKIRDTHQYVVYAIVPPQIDRSKPAHQQADPHLYAGVVKETDSGIVVSGGQQLATGAVFADYIQISCIHPLRPGEENYAISVVVPVGAPGVKLYSRRAFALQAPSAEDYPLTTRFDETDSFVVLDNVHVPWEHVFIYRNPELCFGQWWQTPSHSYGNHQAQSRFATKLRFLLGLAKRMNEATGNDGVPPVQVQMGELAAYASIVENMLLSHETVGPIDEDGVVWPSKPALYAVMALQSQINPAHDRHRAGTHRCRDDHVALLVKGFRQSRKRGRCGTLFRVGEDGRTRSRQADASSLGLHRFGVRQSSPAIREVLWWRLSSRENQHVPKLRLCTCRRDG